MSPVKDLTAAVADRGRANAWTSGIARDDITVEAARAALERNGGNYPAAARELGTRPDTIRRRVPGHSPRGITLDQAVAAIEEHKSLTAAGAALGCSPTTVRDRLRIGGRADLIPTKPGTGPKRDVGDVPEPPAPVAVDRDWQASGVCATTNRAGRLVYDPETWFPITDKSIAGAAQTAEAVALCARCPVKDACLSWALATNQEFGVWGARTEDERRSIRRREQRQRTYTTRGNL